MFKAVVFDLDGTLIDSPLCFKTIRIQLGIPKDEFILEYLAGIPTEERSYKFARLQEIEMKAVLQAKLFPGVREVLMGLRAAGVRTGIFTRNCRPVAEHARNMFDLPIDIILAREDAPPKPDPTGLKIFLERWSLIGRELLFVGDSRFDVECGKKAGVKTALFTNEADLPSTREPDYVIPHYSRFWEGCAYAAFGGFPDPPAALA